MQGVHLRKYGVETIIPFELYEVDGVDFRTDAVDGGTDCTIKKNEAGQNFCVNDFVDGGRGYHITLTATEMEAARITLYFIDTDGTKVYLDKSLTIETYGHTSAQHAFDLGTELASQTVGTCTTNTDMRGTDGVSLVIPDVAGTAPTAVENRQEMDANSTRLDADITSRAPASEYDTELDTTISSRAPASEYDTEMARITGNVALASGVDVAAILGTAITESGAGRVAAAFIKLFDVITPLLVASEVMRGTDSANTTTPPTVTEIQAEMEENGASILDSIRDLLPGTTIAAANDIPAMVGTNNAALASVLGASVGASISVDIAAVQTEVDKIGTIPALDGAGQTIGAAIAKLADDSGGAAFNAGTDSQRKIAATAGASAGVAVTTDVATSDTATSFTLTAGAPAALAYPDMQITVTDANGNQSTETRRISGYTNGRVVTVDTAFSFTPAVGDVVVIERAYLGVSVSGGDATEAKQDLMITDLDLLTKISEADTVIDTSDDSQWVLIFNEKGTNTEIMRKNMIDINGAAITATSAVVGAHEHTTS